MNKKILISVCVVAGLLLALFKPLDNYSEQYIEDNSVAALLTYGAARAINAGLSVIKEIELSISVGGGMAISPGAVLDPLDDLIERFSWVVMMAITSLGIQKLLLMIFSSPLMSGALLLVSAVYLLLLWFSKQQAYTHLALKCVLITLFARFAFALVLLASLLVDRLFIDESKQLAMHNIQQSPINQQLVSTPAGAGRESQGMFESLRAKFVEISDSMDEKLQAIETLSTAVTDALQDILHLIAIFFLQTILLPITFLWLLYKATLMLFANVGTTRVYTG